MRTLTLRGVDEETHARLRARAAQRGRSVAAEVREILRTAVAPPPGSLSSRMRARFAGVGEPELELPDRTEGARAAVFDP